MSYSTGDGSMVHPEYYLRCSKLVGEKMVVTGWAPNIKAAKRHAVAVGGTVYVTDRDGIEVDFFEDPFEVTYNVIDAREVLASTIDLCYNES